MRFWYQSMTPVQHLRNYYDALSKHGKLVLSEGSQVEVHGLPQKYFEGSSPTEVYNFTYAKHRITDQVIEIARHAESKGCAAFILGSFSEPFLAETRAAVEIPVISMAESCILTAHSLGEKVALISLSKVAGRRLSKVIDRHRLAARVEVHALSEAFDENRLNASFSQPQNIIDAFIATARAAVDDGADVVVPAEGVLNELLFSNGVRNVAAATVLDAVGATLLHAEMLVNLKQRLGIGVGRQWAYAKTPAHLMPPVQGYDD